MEGKDISAPQPLRVAAQSFWLVLLLFFLSGASSLIYQVIWTRQMVFVFGSTTFASATVLSAFMGGLALGAFIAGKHADKIRNPLRVYGLLELFVGVWALLLPLLFSACLPLYKAFWQWFHLSLWPFSLLRFFVVSLLLLPPTTAMGATLPLLARFVSSNIALVAGRVGTLYAANTFGAVAGTIGGGFFLIPSSGLNASTIIAAFMNLLLAFAVLCCRDHFVSGEADLQQPAGLESAVSSKPEEAAGAEEEKLPAAPDRLLLLSTLIVFAVSGAVAMVYEVTWTRTLSLVIGSTTFAFTIMLATFLSGISAGSVFSAGFADRSRHPVLSFALLQILLGLAGRLSIELFNYLPYWNVLINFQNPASAELGICVRFLLAGVILLPLALLLGAVFPFAVKIVSVELAFVGRSVANLYSANTVGAIAGSFAAGFLIIPALGGEHTLVCCAAANFICGAVLLWLFCSKNNLVRRLISLILIVIALGSVLQKPSVWDLHLLTAGQKIRRALRWSTAKQILPYAEWRRKVDESFRILFWKDGICANVAVVHFASGAISLFTNGHIDASDRADMPSQALLPSIPLLLKPDAKKVAEVGWGSGSTTGYTLLFPVERVVCAEIEKEVINASRFFHEVNLQPEFDPRLSIEINDGRNYLLATDEKFDLITSEPSNPWQAGVCNLYTREYFQICHDRLSKGGIFALWWQVNEVDADNLCSVFKALKYVFKKVLVFQTMPGDIVVCACDEDLKISLRSVEAALAEPRLRLRLKDSARLGSARDFALLLVMDDEAVAKVAGNARPNTDDRNKVEFDLSTYYEQKAHKRENLNWLKSNAGQFYNAIDWGKMDDKQKSGAMASLAEHALLQDKDMVEAWAQASYQVCPNARALCLLALNYEKHGLMRVALQKADEAVRKFPGETAPLLARGRVELMAGAPFAARGDFASALKLEPDNSFIKLKLAETYMPELRDWYQTFKVPIADSGIADTDAKKTIALLEPLLSDSAFARRNPEGVATLGAALLKQGRTGDGISWLEQYRIYRPDDTLALKLLAGAYDSLHRPKASAFCRSRLAELTRSYEQAGLLQRVQAVFNVGSKNVALRQIKEILENDPDSPEALKLLEKMAESDRHAASYLRELSAGKAAALPEGGR